MEAAMSSTFEMILRSTRARVALAKSNVSRKQLETAAAGHTPRGFRRALRFRAASAPAIIAEIKRASPSRGMIRPEFSAAALARELEAGGAACLSILTEPEFFLGSLGHLELASSNTHLPCLRKDFILDEFQVLEARAHHADAILLIAAALTGAELKQLHAAARALDLDVLCEVHGAADLDRVLAAGCTELIGVNNRDLHDFSVSLDNAIELAARIPAAALRVAESGIDSSAAVARLRAAGYHGFLIGEALMRASHPGEALRDLLAPAARAQGSRA